MFTSNRTRSRQRLSLLFMGLLFSFSALAEEPFIIGVGTHLLNKSGSLTSTMKLIADAGITSVRDDAYWSTVEPRKGQMHIDSVWTKYLSEAAAHRLSPLLVLGYGNPFYGDNPKPRTAPIRSAFANYTKFVSRQLGDSVGFYEIWNEWDQESPEDTALSSDYSALVTEAVQRIRSQNKRVTILAGAVTSKGIDLGFADRLIEADVLSKVDGISLHPSVYCRNVERHTPEAGSPGCATSTQTSGRLPTNRCPCTSQRWAGPATTVTAASMKRPKPLTWHAASSSDARCQTSKECGGTT